ncbi:MAG: response regulator transcription factor [Fusobacteria bacterium]|nr:response regulator transcription factor [Fusobacteriota bacterium]
MRILVVDDEENIASYISKGLKENGYVVDTVYDGETALEYSQKFPYEAVILDIMLPKMSGLEVCEKLKKDGNKAYIIMLTAKDKISDKITGLDCGADDYITKPFAFSELLARLRAILRRDTEKKEEIMVLKLKDVELNLLTRVVMRGGKEIELTTKEFALLEYFVRNKNQTLTRTMIAEQVWDMDFLTESNIIDVYINHLRAKIDKGFDDKLIYTVRGVGYILKS